MSPLDRVGLWVVGRGEGEFYVSAVQSFGHSMGSEISCVISVNLQGVTESGKEGLKFSDDALTCGGW